MKSCLPGKRRSRAGVAEDRVGVVAEMLNRAAIYRELGREFYYMIAARGPVAQGIEQQPSKLKVAGSNPAGVATIALRLTCRPCMRVEAAHRA